MSTVTIRIENLAKRYRVGGPAARPRDVREAFAELVAAPFRRLRSLRAEPSSEDETFWALEDLNLEVRPGEVLGVIGKNGAGKSTLLKILSRITPPTRGRVELRGRVASLLEVGTGFHPDLTGRENVYLNGTLLGMRKKAIDRSFDAIVDFAEVERFIDTPVKRYSSGMCASRFRRRGPSRSRDPASGRSARGRRRRVSAQVSRQARRDRPGGVARFYL